MTRSKKFRKSHPKALRSAHSDKLRVRAANYRVEKHAPILDDELRMIAGDWDPFEDLHIVYCCGCESYVHYDFWHHCLSDSSGDIELHRFRNWLCSIWNPVSQLVPTLPNAAKPAQRLLKREPGADVLKRFSWYDDLGNYGLAKHWSPEIGHRLPAYFPEGRISKRIQSFVQDQLDRGIPVQSLQWLDLVVLFSPFWIRDPNEWTGNSKEDLLAYLFADREYPAFLNEQWINYSLAMDEGFIWQRWLIMLGRGINLSREHSRLHKQFEKHLSSIPWERLPLRLRTTTMILLMAEAKRLGACDKTINRLTRNAAFVSSPLRMSAPFLAFWRDTVCWLVKHIHDYDSNQSDEVLAWAIHMHTEGLNVLIRDLSLNGWWELQYKLNEDAIWEKHCQHPALFRWKGRTTKSALAAARQYHAQLRAIELANIAARFGLRGQLSWNPKGWGTTIKAEQETWEIIELCSLTELIDEGKALFHCVATYAGRCIAGSSAIFSLRLNGIRRLTIEVNCANRQILQARGNSNRTPSSEESEILQRWYREKLSSVYR